VLHPYSLTDLPPSLRYSQFNPQDHSVSSPKSPQVSGSNNNNNINYPPSPTYASSSLGRKVSNTGGNSKNLSYPSHGQNNASCAGQGQGEGPANLVRHGKRPGQIYMQEGIVDMDSFGQILAMDDNDATREFSKALVWAWCDQAEMTVEQMEAYLREGSIIKLCDKAHYLKGSSASLGLVKVSQTCQSIYHSHFPPSLAHLRAFSYTGGGNSGLSSQSSGSGSASGSAFGSGYGSSASAHSSSVASPLFSPPLGSTPYESDSSFTSYYPSSKQSPATSPLYGNQDNPFKFPVPAASTPAILLDSPAAFPSISSESTMQRSPTDLHSPHLFERSSMSFAESAPLAWTNSSSSSGSERRSGGDVSRSGSGSSSDLGSSSEQPETASPTSPSSLSKSPAINQTSNSSASAYNETNRLYFEKEKLDRVKTLLEKLKIEIRQSSEWLYTYYQESDKYAGVTPVPA